MSEEEFGGFLAKLRPDPVCGAAAKTARRKVPLGNVERLLSEHCFKFSLHGAQRVGQLVEIPVAVDSGQRLFGVCQVGFGHLQPINPGMYQAAWRLSWSL